MATSNPRWAASRAVAAPMPRLAPVINTMGAVMRSSLSMLPAAPRRDVDRLDRARKGHGEINIAARDMEVEAVGDERDADQDQERQRQHLAGRMLGDEARDRPRRRIHDHDRDQHGRDHDADVLGYSDRGDDRVDREYQVDH